MASEATETTANKPHDEERRNLITKAFTRIEETYKKKGEVEYGIPGSLADLFLPSPGELIVMVDQGDGEARSLMLSVALEQSSHATSPLPVLVCSTREREEGLMYRLIGMESRLDRTRIQRGLLQMSDIKTLNDAAGVIDQAPIKIKDITQDTIGIICFEIEQAVAQNGIRMVYVDTVSLLSMPEAGAPRWEGIATLISALKRTAMKSNVPVVVHHYMHRRGAGGDDRTELRESTMIETIADAVYMVRPRDPGRERDDAYVVEIAARVCLRGGQGSLGAVACWYDRLSGRMEFHREVPKTVAGRRASHQHP